MNRHLPSQFVRPQAGRFSLFDFFHFTLFSGLSRYDMHSITFHISRGGTIEFEICDIVGERTVPNSNDGILRGVDCAVIMFNVHSVATYDHVSTLCEVVHSCLGSKLVWGPDSRMWNYSDSVGRQQDRHMGSA